MMSAKCISEGKQADDEEKGLPDKPPAKRAHGDGEGH